MAEKRQLDKHLLQALTKAYTARAQLFHNGIVASSIDLLIAEVDTVQDARLAWSLDSLGITRSAFSRVKETGGKPHQVFAHPAVVGKMPHLIGYYRNIATISRKGIGQILFPTEKYEQKRSRQLSPNDAQKLCETLNRIISRVIDSTPDYKVAVSRKAVIAEIGAQLQGTWANMVGQGASRAVEKVIGEYVRTKNLGTRTAPGKYQLKNGWTIAFGTEPDVAFFDTKGRKEIAIEIKGSLDVAGAQTRYGETKKSFAKQIRENPRCHTVYLASCFTDAVMRQIKDDGQVRDYANLTSILYDESERERFLDRLFYIVNAPAR